MLLELKGEVDIRDPIYEDLPHLMRNCGPNLHFFFLLQSQHESEYLTLVLNNRFLHFYNYLLIEGVRLGASSGHVATLFRDGVILGAPGFHVGDVAAEGTLGWYVS